MFLNDITRDHRYISYRQMESEATHCFNSLLEQMSSTHISSLNLVAVIGCVCNIARQRPEEHMNPVLLAIEQLNLNLPPTLGTSQVKSVRKELKMHLLRLLKHPFNHNLKNQGTITGFLKELGATDNEIKKAKPAAADLNEALKRRVAQQQSASQAAAQRRMADTPSTSATEAKRMKVREFQF